VKQKISRWIYLLIDFFKQLNPILLAVLATTLGFIIAERVFFIDGCINTDLVNQRVIPQQVFNDNPDFLTWVTLFIIHNGIAMALGGFAIYYIITLTRKFPISRKEIYSVFAIVLCMILTSALYVLKYRFSRYYHWPQSPLKNQDIKLLILLSISVICASIGVAGMLITSMCAKKSYRELAIETKTFKKYLRLKKYLDHFSVVAGTIFSSGIITVFYFYQAVNQFDKTVPQKFGLNTVIIFGLIFSLFIACAYIPAKFSMNQIGQRIIDKATGDPDNLLEIEFKEWLEKKSMLEKTLMLDVDMPTNLKQVIPIIAPLISSIIPAFLVAG
jgi:hypothetical protein